MFAVLGFMFGGVLLGFFLRKTPLLKYLNYSILVTICLLLLMLGMSVGNNPSIVGNLQTLGAKALLALRPDARVLIAEACTHAPLAEDIGREKIPALLRKRFGDIRIDIVSGNDFPDDLTPYSLIIHCGACMFNRRHVLSRIAAAQAAGVPITNYGVFLAYMNGIIDHVVW